MGIEKDGRAPLSLGEILFSVEGRINRRQYWLGAFVYVLLLIVSLCFLSIVEIAINSSNLSEDDLKSFGLARTFLFCLAPVFYYPIYIKRRQDIGHFKGSWISYGWFLRIGFIKGDCGPNKFGNPPVRKGGRLSKHKNGLSNPYMSTMDFLFPVIFVIFMLLGWIFSLK